MQVYTDDYPNPVHIGEITYFKISDYQGWQETCDSAQEATELWERVGGGDAHRLSIDTSTGGLWGWRHIRWVEVHPVAKATKSQIVQRINLHRLAFGQDPIPSSIARKTKPELAELLDIANNPVAPIFTPKEEQAHQQRQEKLREEREERRKAKRREQAKKRREAAKKKRDSVMADKKKRAAKKATKKKPVKKTATKKKPVKKTAKKKAVKKVAKKATKKKATKKKSARRKRT